MSSELAQIQQQMLNAVTGTSTAVQECLQSGPGCSSERGMDVYRNNRRVVLKSMLSSVYRMVAQIVGDDFFQALIHRYVQTLPSLSGNLHLYGGEMAAMLRAMPEADGLPYLGDVAELEWAWHECYYAADSADFDMAKLAAVAPDAFAQLRFVLSPALQLVRSDYPLYTIWQRHQPDSEVVQVDLGQGGQCVALWRPYGQVQIRPLSRGEYQLLLTLQQGASLQQAVESLDGLTDGDTEVDVQATLGWLLQQRMLVDISLAD
ncbi:DNA-binding domain-containing protein [Pokkaliibacter sp. MBI-7]|uniref:HvfC/BufC N-terminal domain-containing protein n=1 Tax=Pokkaliibacter sp. MBI-7 TaxID=3040600 RepID=UPI00244BE739|nr:DNA-binding domain-containing protein [Pokkaliibacter sp. MBI-7]MDH2434335.1 DNA-binding domain-containing protein [Pokkaliibacter sp. MBI-7]